VKALAVVTAGVPVVAWLLYSWLAFDAVLPTSFYVKTPSAAPAVLVANLGYMVTHLAINGLAAVSLYVAVRLIAGSGTRDWFVEEMRARWGLHLGLVAVLAYGATMAMAHMMFAFRHFVPYTPAAALALAFLLSRVESPPAESPGLRHSGPWLEGVALVVLSVHVAQAAALYHRSLQGLGVQGEYESEGTRGYAHDFIPAMQRNARDVRAHWERLHRDRPPRIWTFAAGALPYAYPQAYIFEELISFRHDCALRLKAHADYVHLFTRHGHVLRLLLPVRARQVRLVSRQRIQFNGQEESLLVYYNPAPLENRLPPRIFQRCIPRLADAR
jgi:hypothetical protein